jgi:hypothetical protein
VVEDIIMFIWLFYTTCSKFFAFSSFPKTRTCGAKVQPVLMLLFSFYQLVNLELSWFSLASISHQDWVSGKICMQTIPC